MRSDVTLRITRQEGSGSRATLKLQGRIAAEWAGLLERECSDLLRSGAAVSVELAEVTFVDRAGIQALQRLGRRGVVILCRSGAVAGVLEGEGIPITREAE